MKWLKSIIDNHLKANPPLWYDMIVTMNLEIRKGESSGYVHVPCAFETLTHSIDLNPSLIKTKTRKEIEWFDPKEEWAFVEDIKEKNYHIDRNKKSVVYNPGKYMVKLNKEEKKLWQLNEIERCSHCGQKTVIAEVKETRYRSCPIIDIRLSDKAKEDLVIPINFGVARAQFYRGFVCYTAGLLLWFYMLYRTLADWQYMWNLLLFFGIGWIMFFSSIRTLKLFQWYIKHRPNAEIIQKQPFWVSLGQQFGVI